MTNSKYNTILSIHHDSDPSAAIVSNGVVLAYSEEERHIRQKHANGIFPRNAIISCLEICGLTPSNIDYIAINWDLESYSNGGIRDFYDHMRATLDINPATKAWQERNINNRQPNNYKHFLSREWYKCFGNYDLPKVINFPHHYTHAFHSFSQSPFDTALCITLDGSGDTECTVLWECNNKEITPIKKFLMPNSLGWFYAAFTEYLGFKAYDGEYKLMGMASFGEYDDEIDRKLSSILEIDNGTGDYEVNGKYIHYGEHSYSERFTDDLVELFGKSPRHPDGEITDWHKNLAFCIQNKLEEAVTSIISWGINETGIKDICVGGGVGLNVKMNSKIFSMDNVNDIFCHPLCSDNGAVCGAGLLASNSLDGSIPEKLSTLSLGHSESRENIKRYLDDIKISYTEHEMEEIPSIVASALNNNQIIGWFQGKMEAGPRALGHRSIIANPKLESTRDRVNKIIKYREGWRPFCPSILSQAVPNYFENYTHSPFMIIAFEANNKLKTEAPAIVHIDGTSRIQAVDESAEPLYYKLIKEFEKTSTVPVILNTSFNIKDEPIVCTAHDAVRTFYSTAMDVLCIENFILRKDTNS